MSGDLLDSHSRTSLMGFCGNVKGVESPVYRLRERGMEEGRKGGRERGEGGKGERDRGTEEERQRRGVRSTYRYRRVHACMHLCINLSINLSLSRDVQGDCVLNRNFHIILQA